MAGLYINSLIRNQYRLSPFIDTIELYIFCMRAHPKGLSSLICNLQPSFQFFSSYKKRKDSIYPGQEEKLSDIFLPPLLIDLSVPLPTVSGWFSSCNPVPSFMDQGTPWEKKTQIYSPSLSAYHLPQPLGHRLIHVLALPGHANTSTPGCWNLCTHPSPPPISSWHHVDAVNAAFNFHVPVSIS